MENKEIICSEHNMTNLLLSLYAVGIAVFMLILLKSGKTSVTTASHSKTPMILGIVAVLFISFGAYMFMRYTNKRVTLNYRAITCVNSMGQRKTYQVAQVKRVDIDKSVRFGMIKYTFEDQTSYKINRSATHYSELETMTYEIWKNIITLH